ncbi:MAG: sensor histidine kinase [Acidimicrobiales bacterium]|jgi:two-component sensor histidine kinase
MSRSLVPLGAKIVPAPDLIRRYTSFDGHERRHLESLMAFWSLLADLSFSDLLLFVPVTRDRGEEGGNYEPTESEGVDHGAFVIIGQMRPTTNQTLYEVDLVGQVQSADSLTNVVEAYESGVIVRSEQAGETADALVRVTNIPVGHRGKVLGVLCRVWSPRTTRRRGTLERVYLDLFERLSVMVADGLFPFVAGPAAAEEAPRVGDGVIVVDAHQRITYASPNAVNALHRASITSAIVGSSLALLGLETSVIDEAFAGKLPTLEEVERPPDVILMIRCIPLIARGETTGAALLLRDVTDLRRRDRLLLTKDATIREVHHRVKNNLQTISSLLRLQARRLDEAEAAGRIALLEAERRIRAIALVHDILARDATEQVPFEQIVAALVNMIRETSTISFPVRIEVTGSLGDVAAEVATPLAVAIAELLQNAVEHAFPEPLSGEVSPWDPGASPAATPEAQGPGTWLAKPAPGAEQAVTRTEPRVDLFLDEQEDALLVVVRDNGCGLPEGFDIDRTRSLGMSIVRDLVRSQLDGTIEMKTDGGTVVRLEIPVTRRSS